MTQTDIIECIKALSRIEGYTMSYEGMKRSHPLYDSIDLIMEKLQHDLTHMGGEPKIQSKMTGVLS